ncbi:MAG: DUF3795 domain-containing protein [Methanosarcinales archaeon]|nr:DUF3795 domain-containing protein [Methanosarcinales archaeon]
MDAMYIIFIAFVAISLIAGILAMFLWVMVYQNVQKGSIAWLLLALTAVFLITTTIFPTILIQYSGDEAATNAMLMFLAFWSVVYTSTFAGAGFLIYRAFKTIPKEYIGEFLVEGMVWSVPEADELSHLFGKSVLVEYTPESRYEDAVIEITLRIFGECRNAILISNEPRISEYKSKLHDLVDIGAMKFIEISATAEEIVERKGIVTLPLNRVEQFSDLFLQMHEGIWIIFEPVSHLISEHGVDRAYDIVSKSVELFSHKQFNVIALINRDAHDRSVISKFEGLFLNQADLTTDKIRVRKGGQEEYIRMIAGEQFFIHGDGGARVTRD